MSPRICGFADFKKAYISISVVNKQILKFLKCASLQIANQQSSANCKSENLQPNNILMWQFAD
jgi:hypothetical protein